MEIKEKEEVVQQQYLTFFLADEEYAINIQRVKEIIEYTTVTKVPKVPEWIRGVINLRGNVVPVVDLAVRFGLEERPITKTTCIVIVEIEQDSERTVMGVIADAVNQVIDLAPKDIEEPPAFGTRVRLEYLFGRYIGILLAYSIFLVSTVAIAFALGRLAIRLATVYSGPVFSLPAAAHSVLEAFSAGALLAAIVLFFSTFLRGWGDVLALIIATVLLASTQPLGFALNKPGIAKAGQIAIQNLYPSLPWESLLQGRQILSEASGRYVLALCVYFVIAAVVFTRREFSYGQD